MKNYGYIKATNQEEAERKKTEIINFTSYQDLEINFIQNLNNLEDNSTIYIDSLCSLGNTVYQILTTFFNLHSKGIKIISYKKAYGNVNLDFFTFNDLQELLKFEQSNIADRLSKTQNTLVTKEKKVGKKSGKKTKSVFNKHKRFIFKELDKKTFQVQILKLLQKKDSVLQHITPQALGRYIKKQK